MKLLHCLSVLFVIALAGTTVAEKIVIVGAGAAGIAAATRLIEKNLTDFIILEAERRLGGRIHSIFLLDGPEGGHVDLGGEYVGGEVGNVVYELAKDDLKHTDVTKITKAFYPGGQIINDEITKEILTFKDGLNKWYEKQPPISARDAYLERYNKTILEKYKDDPSKRQIASDFIDTCESIFQYRHGAFDWSKILVNGHYKVCPGDQGLNWNGKGYVRLLDNMMRTFGDEHRLRLFPIHYSTTVKKIIWNKSEQAVILTNGRAYRADHVIFTPSVGVLKENHQTLFEPKLPANKVEAIKNTGFDGAMKIILQYNKKWWDDDVGNFIFVWKDQDAREIRRELSTGPEKDGKSWMTYLNRLFTVPGMPDILIAWFTGPLVPEIEKIDAVNLKKGIDLVIRKFLGPIYNITEPQIVIPSNWYSNPNFRGVYSYETMAAGQRGKQYQEDLAEPLVNQQGSPEVLFAGEHTHKTHFSSVHGAVETGFDAADRLSNYLNSKSM